jgi:manganese oxidase
MHVGAPVNAAGGTLVYNHRSTTVAGNFVNEDGTVVNLTHQGPLHDPTAMILVRSSDLEASGANKGKLKPGVPLEPVVIRAAAGDCVQVTLRNNLPALAPDLATYSTLLGVVKRDRGAGNDQGSTTFNQNLIRASSYVGLHPQLVALDVTQHSGRIVGANPLRGQLVAPQGGNPVPGTSAAAQYQWYAGDLNGPLVSGQVAIAATPIEFGGFNVQPADPIKQGGKSLVGAMVVHPQGATWVEDTQVFDHQNGAGTRATRAQATVTAGATTFRDFSLVLTKGNTHHYRDGTPVEHMNGEGVGIPEDSQEASGMSLNYGIEPLWFRFGILPQAPFGNCPGCYGGIANPELAYSNSLAGGDPATPVFLANRNQQTRIHITNPHGTTRGSTFAVHGHVWQRDPYICPGEARNGLTGACNMTSVGSRAIGTNPQGFATAGQESWTPASHFSVVLPSAGGGNGVVGDYLARDYGAFGNASGVWSIIRVK